MEVVATSLKEPVKRARPGMAAEKAASAVVPVKKKAALRKPKPEKPSLPAPDVLAAMISTAAYFLAADRGFVPGYEVDDWLQAEKQILALYT